MADRVLLYKLAFSMLKGMKPSLRERLMGLVGDEERFFSLSSAQLSATASRRIGIFEDAYRNEVLEAAHRELQFVESRHIDALYVGDDAYPTRLRECFDAPMMLYGLGDYRPDSPAPVVAIVGTRHATPYGVDFTRRLVADLASTLIHKPTIVSGLALGIDVVAHEAAMAAGLPTVAVVGHGLNTIYPAVHRPVAARIVRSGGAILTEYTSESPLHRGNFLARNRIIAGLADCTVVVESGEKGGALSTARYAQGYNRDVMALPGRIGDPYSRGCNRLIARNVASLITCASDLVEAMGWETRQPEGSQQSLAIDLTPEEEAVVQYLTTHSEARVNELSVALGIELPRLLTVLVDMEFKELVLPFPGSLYRLR